MLALRSSARNADKHSRSSKAATTYRESMLDIWENKVGDSDIDTIDHASVSVIEDEPISDDEARLLGPGYNYAA